MRQFLNSLMDPPPDNALMDPKEGDYVRFKPKRESTGTVIKRSGTRIRVQPKDGGATLWKELMAAQSAQAAEAEAEAAEERLTGMRLQQRLQQRL
ncbi:hypothetical protein Ctob_009043 [Chrysochromulina tobinii]|uniref:Uncharacterized protein n=1 Tax=Chrysochromulina tobinii TaxID=1460289 RepID=A0A0M0JW97_9EUKA|nr:hypothetical protein Ctob_009043 [Chrysochromulina tobinii]|eukprot:KOO30567.1 hypothetical protein Ctob_009043 [Chrysochromulina sp. CCMP291]